MFQTAILILAFLAGAGCYHLLLLYRRRARSHSGPGPDLIPVAQNFIQAVTAHFQFDHCTPQAWKNDRGKITVPAEVRKPYWAFKAVLAASGRRRTPAGHRLVEAAFKILQQDPPDLRSPL